METFNHLFNEYIQRSGISDAELARTIGVSRQTIFRWREGLTSRPRNRDDVLIIAKKLRLSDEERDTLLLAAGFRPPRSSSPLVCRAADLFDKLLLPAQTPRDTGSRGVGVFTYILPFENSILSMGPALRNFNCISQGVGDRFVWQGLPADDFSSQVYHFV